MTVFIAGKSTMSVDMTDNLSPSATEDALKTKPESETGQTRPVWRPLTWAEVVDLSHDTEPAGPGSPGLETGPTRLFTLAEIKTQQQGAKEFADGFPQIDSDKYAELNARAAQGEDVGPVHIDELTID